MNSPILPVPATPLNPAFSLVDTHGGTRTFHTCLCLTHLFTHLLTVQNSFILPCWNRDIIALPLFLLLTSDAYGMIHVRTLATVFRDLLTRQDGFRLFYHVLLSCVAVLWCALCLAWETFATIVMCIVAEAFYHSEVQRTAKEYCSARDREQDVTLMQKGSISLLQNCPGEGLNCTTTPKQNTHILNCKYGFDRYCCIIQHWKIAKIPIHFLMRA